MAIGSIVIVFARREIKLGGVSLEWLAGGAVFLAILLHELIDSLSVPSSKKKNRQPEPENSAETSKASTPELAARRHSA